MTSFDIQETLLRDIRAENLRLQGIIKEIYRDNPHIAEQLIYPQSISWNINPNSDDIVE